MSLLVGTVRGRTTYLAADSGMWNEFQSITREPKIFSSGPVLIAAAGSFRVSNVLRYMDPLPTPARIEDPTRYLVREVVPGIRAALTEAGLKTEDMDAVLLLALPGYLAALSEDFSVTACRDIPYVAIGRPSSVGVALGSLWTMRQLQSGWTPENELSAAIIAASCHTDAALPPIDHAEITSNDLDRYPYLADR